MRELGVSSSAPAVYNFIRSHGKQFDNLYYTPASMAEEALKIADGQGIFKTGGDFLGIDKAWERSFSYGEVAKTQWLAEIYLDVDLSGEESYLSQGGFRRVLVGAPLWIKTPEPQAIRLYAQTDLTDLADAKPSAKRRKDVTLISIGSWCQLVISYLHSLSVSPASLLLSTSTTH
jgi:hypothetical protein